MKYMAHTITPRQGALGRWYCLVHGPGRITETKALAGGRFANLLYACRCLKAQAKQEKEREAWALINNKNKGKINEK